MFLQNGNLVPKDEKLFFFSIALRIAQWPLVNLVLRFFKIILFNISPSVPVYLSDSFRKSEAKRAFVSGIVLGYVFCLGGTFLFATIDRTLYGTDPNRVYLINDLPNIINYSLLCPLYVGLSSHLVVLLLSGWKEVLSIPLRLTNKNLIPRRSIAFSFFLINLISIIFTINYICESIDPSIYPKIGWWVARTTQEGERLLGYIGIYYTILNFGLFVICMFALFSFLSMFFLCIRIGKALSDENIENKITFDGLKNSLKNFTQMYLSAKLLAAVLMLNAYTWKLERPHGSFNLTAMGLALAVFGVFFVSIPRYYIELEWFKLKVRKAIVMNKTEIDYQSIQKDDLRPFSTRIVAHVIDVLIISGFITTFFTWNQ